MQCLGTNGSQKWSGLIGNVAYNKADVAVGGVVVQQSRCAVAEPSVGYIKDAVQV